MIKKKQKLKPEILAPAGDRESFFAALAAGADSIYCSVKNFSARMEADNFSIDELSRLSEMAKKKGVKLYLAFNSMLKEDELSKVGKMLVRVKRYVKPDALIVSDLAYIPIIKQVGMRCDIHLSTLSGLSVPGALATAKKLGFSRVVLPRELNIDEIKAMASSDTDMELETFIHGALCYGVSGRCYWSSWLGGKSGIRGRCVQPCRRIYTHEDKKKSFFSCSDFGLDVLVKVLQEIKGVKAWKIEGRKKSAHYVYYTTWGYKDLRDNEMTAREKKETSKIFEQALSRPLSHYNFLPQRKQNPVEKTEETVSGKFVGRIKATKDKIWLEPWEDLIKGDRLRIGNEGEKSHATVYVPLSIPKGGKFIFKKDAFKFKPKTKTSVFLIDRKEPELLKEIEKFESEFNTFETIKQSPPTFSIPSPFKPLNLRRKKKKPVYYEIKRLSSLSKKDRASGFYVDGSFIERLEFRKSEFKKYEFFFLPPVIWPSEEDYYKNAINRMISLGACNFIVNSPWHIHLLPKRRELEIWAGPFCNISNTLAIGVLKTLGFTGVIVDPELSGEDFLKLPKMSPLPLGMVTGGYFPFAISRIVSNEIKEGELFISPKKETGFVKKHDENYYIYPSWELDLKDKEGLLKNAGYSFFIRMDEKPPVSGKKMRRMKSKWNWDLSLL